MDPLCYVCKKQLERNELGFSKITHPRCAPGTEKWCQWFKKLPKRKQSEAGSLLYKWALRKKERKLAKP